MFSHAYVSVWVRTCYCINMEIRKYEGIDL